MKNILRLWNNVTKTRKERKQGYIKNAYLYSENDYERAKASVGMFIIVELLKEVDVEVREQPFLKNNIQMLAEKAINKINLKKIVIDKEVSYQMLRFEYSSCLNIFGMWKMIEEKFIDYSPCVTEEQFRRVAALLYLYLTERSKEEETTIEAVSKNYINVRNDGHIEIVFPAKIWGDKQLTTEMIKNAEEAGVCFVDINASPIYRKAILPYNWSISKNKTWDGFRFIFDENGCKRGEFRLKKLPSDINNGEFDFFFDQIPKEINDKNMKVPMLLSTNCFVI